MHFDNTSVEKISLPIPDLKIYMLGDKNKRPMGHIVHLRKFSFSSFIVL
jgi:hypothetical protein